MIDTLLFDLDHTLLDFSKAERQAVSKTLVQLGVTPDEQVLTRFSELNLAQWKLLEQGIITRSQVKVRRYQLLFDEIHVDRPAEKAAKIYEAFLGTGHYFMDGAEKLLQELSPKYRLYIVTNGTASVQKGRLKSAGLQKYVKDIFISEEIGFNKPSKEYFDHCFMKIPVFQRESAVIIGDSLTSDIQGGINAGIQTIWFNPSKVANSSDIYPDYEVSSLQDIPALLKSIDNR